MHSIRPLKVLHGLSWVEKRLVLLPDVSHSWALKYDVIFISWQVSVA